MYYVPFVEIEFDNFEILLNQNININYLFKYVLLSEGDHRGPLIKKFLNFIACTKKCDFSKMIEEVIESHEDADSIIIYCNEFNWFNNFVKHLPQSLKLSYCQFVKNKNITKFQVQFLTLLLEYLQNNIDQENNIIDTLINFLDKNYSGINSIILDILTNLKLHERIKYKFANFIYERLKKTNNTISNSECSLLNKIVTNEYIQEEIKHELLSIILKKLEKRFYEISINEYNVLKTILIEANIKKEIKNKLVNFIFNTLEKNNHYISDFIYFLLQGIIHSENIEKNIKNQLADIFFNKVDNQPFEISYNWWHLLTAILSNQKIEKIIKNKLMNLFLNIVKDYFYSPYHSPYNILQDILKNKDVDEDIKNKLLNLFADLLEKKKNFQHYHTFYYAYALLKDILENEDIKLDTKKELVRIFLQTIEEDDGRINHQNYSLLLYILEKQELEKLEINKQRKKKLIHFIINNVSSKNIILEKLEKNDGQISKSEYYFLKIIINNFNTDEPTKNKFFNAFSKRLEKTYAGLNLQLNKNECSLVEYILKDQNITSDKKNKLEELFFKKKSGKF